MKRGQGFDATIPHFYEAPMDDPDYLEVWCYTQALSFEAGRRCRFSSQYHCLETLPGNSTGRWRASIRSSCEEVAR